MSGTIISLLAAAGFGGIIVALVNHVADWLKGRKAEERDAWADRDREARARRKLEETLHATRRVAIDAGVAEAALPPWPHYD